MRATVLPAIPLQAQVVLDGDVGLEDAPDNDYCEWVIRRTVFEIGEGPSTVYDVTTTEGGEFACLRRELRPV